MGENDIIFNRRVIFAILLYCVFAGLVIFIRPYPLYDEELKKFRRFGVGPDETLFSLGTVLILGAIIAYAFILLFSSFDDIDNIPLGQSPQPIQQIQTIQTIQSPQTPQTPQPVQPIQPIQMQQMQQTQQTPQQLPQQSGGYGGPPYQSHYSHYYPPPFHGFNQYDSQRIQFPPSRIWKS